jgi:hypothetical protein
MDIGIFSTVEGSVAYRPDDNECKDHTRGIMSGQVQVAADYLYQHKILKSSRSVKLLDGCLFGSE